jgi:hypothetical protein
MVSTADSLIKRIDGVFRGREQGPQFIPSIGQSRILFTASLRLSLVAQERFDFRMAFDFVGKGVRVEH